MPLIRKWKRTSLVWQLAILLMVSLVIIGALVIAVIGLVTAKSALGCVNTTLGKRNGPANEDAKAHIAYAQASKVYDAATLMALLAPPGPTQKAAFEDFIVAAKAKNTADDNYVKALAADQKYRDAHPLGRC